MLQTHETNKWKEICTYSMHKQGKNRSNSTEAGEKATIFPKQKKTSKICKHVENHGKRQETHRNCRKPRKIEEGTGSKEQKMETTTQKQKRKKAREPTLLSKKKIKFGPISEALLWQCDNAYVSQILKSMTSFVMVEMLPCGQKPKTNK